MYDSIENLPVYNFNKINETGDLKYLLKGSLKVPQTKLEKCWIKIYDEFLTEFGLSEKFSQWLEKQKQIVAHIYNAYVEGKRHEINFVRLKEMQAEELMKGDEQKIGEVAAMISEYMHFPIDIRTITVYQFYHYLNRINGRASKDNTRT